MQTLVGRGGGGGTRYCDQLPQARIPSKASIQLLAQPFTLWLITSNVTQAMTYAANFAYEISQTQPFEVRVM